MNRTISKIINFDLLCVLFCLLVVRQITARPDLRLEVLKSPFSELTPEEIQGGISQSTMTLEQIQEGIDAYKNVLGKLNSIPKVMAPAKKVIATAMLQSIKKFLEIMQQNKGKTLTPEWNILVLDIHDTIHKITAHTNIRVNSANLQNILQGEPLLPRSCNTQKLSSDFLEKATQYLRHLSQNSVQFEKFTLEEQLQTMYDIGILYMIFFFSPPLPEGEKLTLIQVVMTKMFRALRETETPKHEEHQTEEIKIAEIESELASQSQGQSQVYYEIMFKGFVEHRKGSLSWEDSKFNEIFTRIREMILLFKTLERYGVGTRESMICADKLAKSFQQILREFSSAKEANTLIFGLGRWLKLYQVLVEIAQSSKILKNIEQMKETSTLEVIKLLKHIDKGNYKSEFIDRMKGYTLVQHKPEYEHLTTSDTPHTDKTNLEFRNTFMRLYELIKFIHLAPGFLPQTVSHILHEINKAILALYEAVKLAQMQSLHNKNPTPHEHHEMYERLCLLTQIHTMEQKIKYEITDSKNNQRQHSLAADISIDLSIPHLRTPWGPTIYNYFDQSIDYILTMMERVSNIRATREIFYREITILLNMANNLYAMVIMVPLEIEKSVEYTRLRANLAGLILAVQDRRRRGVSGKLGEDSVHPEADGSPSTSQYPPEQVTGIPDLPAHPSPWQRAYYHELQHNFEQDLPVPPFEESLRLFQQQQHMQQEAASNQQTNINEEELLERRRQFSEQRYNYNYP